MTLIQKIKNQKITSIVIASMLVIGSLSITNMTFAEQPPKPALALAFNPNPVLDGNLVTMSGNVTVNSALSDYGKLQLQQGLNADDSPAINCPAAKYVTIVDNIDHTTITGKWSYNGFDTTGLGGKSRVFQMNIAPAGDPISGNQSDCVRLDINAEAECEGEIQISAEDSNADPDNGIFGYKIKVEACTDVENLKIQGGSNGWSEITDFVRDPVIGDLTKKEQPKKNTVFYWKIPELGPSEAYDEVTFTVIMKSLKEISCGETVQINGGWSVAYNLPNDNTKYKAGYTSPLTYTNECQ